jgi:hypothetical protein
MLIQLRITVEPPKRVPRKHDEPRSISAAHSFKLSKGFLAIKRFSPIDSIALKEWQHCRLGKYGLIFGLIDQDPPRVRRNQRNYFLDQA